MLGLKRVAVASSVMVAGLLLAAVPSLADDIYGNVDCGQSPSPACELAAGKGGKSPSGHGANLVRAGGDSPDSGNDGLECRYVPVDYRDSAGQPTKPGGWYMVLCSPDGKDPYSHGPVFLPNGADGVPALSPAQLSQIARKRLQLPTPTIAASPTGDQLVHLPTWLWLSSGWAPKSASASVPGVSVTAVATPTSVSWSMGDGETVICTGPGSPFRAGNDPMSSSPDCGYTYRTSSAGQPGQAFPVSAMVHWTVTWSGAGQGGTFPDMTTTASTALRVAEAPALNNGGG